MKPQFSVMLIDDSDDDNFIHEIIIKKVGFATSISVYQYAEVALEYLKIEDRDGIDIIFLDINMPRMNGFEFLDEYAKLSPEQQARCLLFMVSTSLNPQDKQRAEDHGAVTAFIGKPLTVNALEEVVTDYLDRQ
ncbi:MAG: response regulator [Pseudomonadota bacterium]